MKVRSLFFALLSFGFLSTAQASEFCFVQDQVQVAGIPKRVCLSTVNVGNGEVAVVVTSNKNKYVSFMGSTAGKMKGILFSTVTRTEACGMYERFNVEVEMDGHMFMSPQLDRAEVYVSKVESNDICQGDVKRSRFYYEPEFERSQNQFIFDHLLNGL